MFMVTLLFLNSFFILIAVCTVPVLSQSAPLTLLNFFLFMIVSCTALSGTDHCFCKLCRNKENNCYSDKVFLRLKNITTLPCLR